MAVTTIQQSFDRQPVPGASLEDLDLALVDATIRAGQEAGRYDGPSDIQAYLVRYGGGVTAGSALQPTVASVLAFTHEPERWLTASGIDIAIYRSDQTSPTQARVRQMRGSIFDIIDSTVALLQDECSIGRMDGARVVNELDTPLAVLRELTTNAVVHRDLSLFGSQVRIQIFPRYIEWISPGGLPANVTIATLLTAQFARNPGLAQFLFHRTYIEKFGMGLDLVIETMRRERLGRPEFHDDVHSFRVRVPRKQILATHVPDLSTRDGRTEAILVLFQERNSWRQRELIDRLQIPRSTLQRDLEELVHQQRLIARGATRSRIYVLPDTERVPAS
jgi:ATP-dependent DNA helicase RecG